MSPVKEENIKEDIYDAETIVINKPTISDIKVVVGDDNDGSAGDGGGNKEVQQKYAGEGFNKSEQPHAVQQNEECSERTRQRQENILENQEAPASGTH